MLIVRFNLSADNCRNNPRSLVISLGPRNQLIPLGGTVGVTVNVRVKELGVTAICVDPLSGVTVGTVREYNNEQEEARHGKKTYI